MGAHCRRLTPLSTLGGGLRLLPGWPGRFWRGGDKLGDAGKRTTIRDVSNSVRIS